MNFKFISFLIIIIISFNFAYGQNWVDMMQDPNSNFYDVQKAFNTYWEGKTPEKGKGWKSFKRWEYFMEQRVYPTGNMNFGPALWNAMQEYKTNFTELKKNGTANWTCMGPFNVPPLRGGAGRVNCITFYPGNNNIIFAGAPSGGLWKSTDGGSTWATYTDLLPNIGVTDVVINPDNPDIMYMATGDGDAGDTYSYGILKSTDGGQTWITTGLSWNVTQMRKISRLLIHPQNPDTVYAATSNGIYRTTNGGTVWTSVNTAKSTDMAFQPGNPSEIWAVSANTLYLSTNSGTSFSTVSSFNPGSTGRLALSVTAADPNYLYILGADNQQSGLVGVWRSTNNGTSFSQTTGTTPNLLGVKIDGSDAGGQGWYDLCLVANPSNKDDIFVGGVNIWQSLNGGTNWVLNANWYGGEGYPYVHADIHALKFIPGSNDLITGCDGGVFKGTGLGSTWTDLSNGMTIGQIYRLGCSATDPALVMSGWQDNGTNLYSSSSWTNVIGGDGMDCLIDYSNSNYMYGELYFGGIYRSYGGANFFPITSSITEQGNWITPYIQDPQNPQTLWAGYINLWKSTDRGDTWAKVTNFTDTHTISYVAVSPSNTDYVYIYKNSTLQKSTNGGTSWTSINLELPTGTLTSLALHPTDVNTIWASFSGYSSGNKVFKSINGGSSWTNISANIPNISANTIIRENGSDDGLYVGTDIGVFYRDNTMKNWIAYNTGLPNVVVDELQIQYSSGKIRAATFGRGLWESDLYSATSINNLNAKINNKLLIYPNPGNGLINIDLGDAVNNEKVNLEVYNYAGMMVYSEETLKTSNCCITVDLSKEANGLYLIKINSKKGYFSGTFIKN